MVSLFDGYDGVVVSRTVRNEKYLFEFVPSCQAEAHRVPAEANGDTARFEHSIEAVFHPLVEPPVLSVLCTTLPSNLLIAFGNLSGTIRRVEKHHVGTNNNLLYKILGKHVILSSRGGVEVIRHRTPSGVSGKGVNNYLPFSEPSVK